MNKKTPLHQEHVGLSAKMCPFAGYDMPIQYSLGVLQEHEWTRSHAGLFDVSHMGQALVSGSDATEFFARITPSSFTKTPAGGAKYTVLTNEQGGIVDDLIITKIDEQQFFVVFNAARKEVDIAWMKQHLPTGVTFKELADHALVALQGPQAEAVLTREFPAADLASLPYMRLKKANWKEVPVFISRLGYTGEDGFEISIPATKVVEFWRALLTHAEVKPIGLAARDSLRLEMGYPLYGHDLTEQTTPIEAALGWVMAKTNQNFIGAAQILPQIEKGASQKRVGIKLLESGIAREGAAIYADGKQIGTLTSGGFSPSLKISIGQAYLPIAYAKEGQKVEIDVRGRKIPATVHALSFVPAHTKKSA